MFAEVTSQVGYAELRTQARGGYLALHQWIRCICKSSHWKQKVLRYSLLLGIFDEVR